MNNNWPSETLPEWLLFPGVLLFVKRVRWEHLFTELFLLNLYSGLLLFGGSLALVLQVESDWQLEVELNCAALMASSKGIIDLDINLGSIESTLSLIEFPWLSIGIQCILKSFLRDVPKRVITQTLVWPRSCRKFQLVSESEKAVDVIEEIKTVSDLVLDLLLGTVDVSIVLLEASHSGKSGEGTGELVSVEHSEVSKAHRQVSERPELIVVHETVSRAIHGLHAVNLVSIALEPEHAVSIVGVMA